MDAHGARSTKRKNSKKEIQYASCLHRSPSGHPHRCQEAHGAKLNTAIEEVYPIGETLIFLREYPLDNFALNGGLQSENPNVLEAVKKTMNT
jgi:hypothetical protein